MLYDRPVRLLLEDCLAVLSEDFRSEEAIAWFAEKYPMVDVKTVRAHLRAFSANDPNRRHYSFGRGRPALLFKTGRSTYSRYDAEVHGLYDEQGLSLDDEDTVDDEGFVPELEETVQERAAEFALEVYLEEFLLTNWHKIGWGAPLELYNGREGHQFVTTVGRLDFLAVDTRDMALVVIELKRGRPSDQVVGQAARYMGWIKHTMAGGRPVRGLIVAHEIDDKLKFAASMIDGLDLMSYEITFGLKPERLAVASP